MQVHRNAVRVAQLLATLGLASALPVPGLAQEPRPDDLAKRVRGLQYDPTY